ncbi:hypothetical protein EI94DRAFT_1594329 [Lactarius quietus]|nr:hypothetical protein EI94DRAFT_1594329 [Lactarius quietus]
MSKFEKAGYCGSVRPSSLPCEQVTLGPPNLVTFDFLSKDSIRYHNNLDVDECVFENIKVFKRARKAER